MTGTWRDTLFVWQGSVFQKKNDKAESAGSSQETLEWKGTWIGCQDCPDARMAPTPVVAAFEASDMTFSVSGTGIKGGKDASFWKFDLTGGSGWDLGEGDEKKVHQDHRHQVLLPRLPWEYGEEVRPAIVAVGENEFGSFVSAGYLRHGNTDNDNGSMILARRYLDEGDARASWSVEELYERICKTDKGIVTMVPHQLWFDSSAQWRIAPWRSLDLHADKVIAEGGAKRKRDDGDDSQEDAADLPPLHITAEQGFSPKITIDVTSSEFLEKPISSVKWVEQCYGCGNEVRHASQACCKEVMEYTKEEPNQDIGSAFYCGDACVHKYGAKAWADAGRQWARDLYGTGYFLKSNGNSSFWKAIVSNKKSLQVMKDAGWKKGWMDYNLHAEG